MLIVSINSAAALEARITPDVFDSMGCMPHMDPKNHVFEIMPSVNLDECSKS